MLRNFKCTLDKLEKVPFSEDLYISYHLELYQNDEEIFKDKDVVEVELGGKKVEVTKAWLGCLTYKTPTFDLDTCLRCEARIIDPNKANDFIGNYGWKYPVGGIEHPDYPGYNYVPGATSYIVNRNAEMINCQTGTMKKAKVCKNSYTMMRIVDDCGKTLAPMMHRLVSLAWSDYPMNYYDFVVNHKDGNCSNNSIDNLEWVTQEENMQHAKDNGLIRSKRVLIKTINDGVITSYKNAAAAAKVIGVSTSTIVNWCRWGSNFAFRNLYQVKYEVNPIPFTDNPKLVWDKNDLEDLNKDQLIIKNYHNGEVFTANDAHEASDITGIQHSTIIRLLFSKDVGIVKGFAFIRKGEQKTWPKVPEDKLPFYLYFNGKTNPIKVTELSVNVIRYFSDVYEVSKYYNIPSYGVKIRLDEKTKSDTIYNLKLEYINP